MKVIQQILMMVRAMIMRKVQALQVTLVACCLFSALNAHAADRNFFNSYREAAKTYIAAFGLGYISGLVPPITPATLMVVVMGASDNSRMLEKKDAQRLSSGQKIMYTYATGVMLGFATLALGTYKGTRWIIRKLRG